MKPITRTLSFFTTWFAEIVRQPVLILMLVVGPFLILVAFGQGVNVKGIKPDVILVRSADEAQPLQPLPEELSDYVNVVEETEDLTGAIRRLQDGEVDAVAVVPPNAEQSVTNGERVPLQMFTSEIDPLTVRFTETYLGDQVGQLNQRTIEKAIRDAQSSFDDVREQVALAQEYLAIARDAEGNLTTVREQVDQAQALLVPLSEAVNSYARAAEGISFVLPGIGRSDRAIETLRTELRELTENVNRLDSQLASTEEGGSIPTGEEIARIEEDLDAVLSTANDLQAIPPEVLSAPFDLELRNVGPWEPEFVGYYSPAVLALLVQHLAISLAALALARMRILGLIEFLKVSPIRPFEIMSGQYLSYGLVVSAVGLVVMALMNVLLDVPLFGSLAYAVAIVVTLALVCLGIGFLISLVSPSEQQATQITMLLLLAAVFFSGLVVSLDRLTWPVRAVAFALPSTYATRSLHDVMLRGVVRHPIDLAVLAALAVALYAASVMVLRMQMRPR
jgi:ABC-2 type transport system permease protein